MAHHPGITDGKLPSWSQNPFSMPSPLENGNFAALIHLKPTEDKEFYLLKDRELKQSSNYPSGTFLNSPRFFLILPAR